MDMPITTNPISSDILFMEAADVLVQKNLLLCEAGRKVWELKQKLMALKNGG